MKRPKMKNLSLFDLFGGWKFFYWLGGLWVAAVGAVAFVIYHFITKFW